MKKLLIVCVLLCLALGCDGEQGPVGLEGTQGAEGAEGPPGPVGVGSRVVYPGRLILEGEPNPFCVSVPEIDLDDMPIVSVYISNDGGESWVELPARIHSSFENTWAAIRHREVCLYGCTEWEYRIVVIK